jgi:hypothetical protein
MEDEVSPLVMPTKSQRELWWHLVMADDGVDPAGYWLGWCPVHDEEHDPELASAQFNFRKGVMRCLGEPCCHDGKKVISLTNVMTMKMEGVNRGQR